MTQPDLSRVALRPSPDVVARHIAGEHLIVPVRRGAAEIDFLYTADEVGSFIYGLLDGRRAAGAIASLVTREFEVEFERAEVEVVEFLQALYEAGLAQPAAAGPR